MPELHWPRRSHYRGNAVDVVGPTTVDVPADAVEHLRSRGWVDPPEANEPDDPEDEADEPDATDADEFDAAAFVDRAWQSVKSDIEDGDVDDHLDAVEAAENDRDDPRPSVLNAVGERR